MGPEGVGGGCAGAPVLVTEDLLKTFNVSLVVRGATSETRNLADTEGARYAVPCQRDIFRCAPSTADVVLLRRAKLEAGSLLSTSLQFGCAV